MIFAIFMNAFRDSEAENLENPDDDVDGAYIL